MKKLLAFFLVFFTGLFASAQVSKVQGVTPATISGSGTTNYVPLWLSKNKLGNSEIFQAAENIGTTAPEATLDVHGSINVAGRVLTPKSVWK